MNEEEIRREEKNPNPGKKVRNPKSPRNESKRTTKQEKENLCYENVTKNRVINRTAKNRRLSQSEPLIEPQKQTATSEFGWSKKQTDRMNSQKEWEWDQSGCWVQKCMPDPAMDLNPRVLESMLKNEGTIFYFHFNEINLLFDDNNNYIYFI